jgi:hypothetical protein
MTLMVSANATCPAALADRHDGRVSAKGECQLRRQCPNCMRVTDPARSACESCGLQFFKPARTEEQSLRGIYVRTGAGAFLLAGLIATALRYL